MEPEASLSWLALTLTPGVAARLTGRLLREFGTPEAVFRASLTALEACNLPAPAAQAIFKKQMFWRAEKEVDAIRRIGCRILNCTEPEYPQSLLQIYDQHALLYVRGDASILNAPSISIVGTRRPTVYGTQIAERMGRDLAKRGLVVVSGLARGVDALAHRRASYFPWGSTRERSGEGRNYQ
jgi:DNA processing protein